MQAIGADPPGEIRIRADQKLQAAPPAEQGQPSRDQRAIGRAEMAVDDAGAAGQPRRGRKRVRRTLGIGQQQNRRQSRAAARFVEPARYRA
jgi:hypothetical protein